MANKIKPCKTCNGTGKHDVLEINCQTCFGSGVEGGTHLHYLEIGDLFILLTEKKKLKTTWLVRSNSFYNGGYHGWTMNCAKLKEPNDIIGKSSKNLVLKIGESKHKERYKKSPVAKYKMIE